MLQYCSNSTVPLCVIQVKLCVFFSTFCRKFGRVCVSLFYCLDKAFYVFFSTVRLCVTGTVVSTSGVFVRFTPMGIQ